MKLIYPAIFHKDENSYWVTFPDLIGCQSFGDTIDETLENGKEALEGDCLNILESNKKLPTPSNIQDIKVEKDCFSSLIDVNVKIKSKKAVKKSVSIPAWLNDLAIKNDINFSNVLSEALFQKLVKTV